MFPSRRSWFLESLVSWVGVSEAAFPSWCSWCFWVAVPWVPESVFPNLRSLCSRVNVPDLGFQSLRSQRFWVGVPVLPDSVFQNQINTFLAIFTTGPLLIIQCSSVNNKFLSCSHYSYYHKRETYVSLEKWDIFSMVVISWWDEKETII